MYDPSDSIYCWLILLTSELVAFPEMDAAEAIVRIQGHLG
jgi:hypothetical protein